MPISDDGCVAALRKLTIRTCIPLADTTTQMSSQQDD